MKHRLIPMMNDRVFITGGNCRATGGDNSLGGPIFPPVRQFRQSLYKDSGLTGETDPRRKAPPRGRPRKTDAASPQAATIENISDDQTAAISQAPSTVSFSASSFARRNSAAVAVPRSDFRTFRSKPCSTLRLRPAVEFPPSPPALGCNKDARARTTTSTLNDLSCAQIYYVQHPVNKRRLSVGEPIGSLRRASRSFFARDILSNAQAQR
jgi:hypothetical protein